MKLYKDKNTESFEFEALDLRSGMVTEVLFSLDNQPWQRIIQGQTFLFTALCVYSVRWKSCLDHILYLVVSIQNTNKYNTNVEVKIQIYTIQM